MCCLLLKKKRSNYFLGRVSLQWTGGLHLLLLLHSQSFLHSHPWNENKSNIDRWKKRPQKYKWSGMHAHQEWHPHGGNRKKQATDVMYNENLMLQCNINSFWFTCTLDLLLPKCNPLVCLFFFFFKFHVNTNAHVRWTWVSFRCFRPHWSWFHDSKPPFVKKNVWLDTTLTQLKSIGIDLSESLRF